MKISLKILLPLLVALFICSITVAISFFTLRHEKQYLSEERDIRGKLLLRGLVSAGEDAILSNNRPKLLSYCNSLALNEKDVEYTMVIDINSNIIAHNNPAMVGRVCKSSLCKSALQSRKMMITGFKYENDSLFEYSAPLSIADKRIGSVRIVMSNESIRHKGEELLLTTLIISGIVLVISIIISILAVHFLITRPVNKLKEGIDITSSGNFNNRMNVKGGNEIGTLIKLFNRMNSSLLSQKKQLLSLHNTVHLQDAKKGFVSLTTQTLDIINDIIGPDKCILSLFEDNNLIIKNYSGFKSDKSIIGKDIILPNDIFSKTFQKPITRKYIVDELSESFSELSKKLQYPADEILISPLVHGKKSKGILFLIGKKNGKEYTKSDMEYLDLISLSTALSLSYVELLENLDKKEEVETYIAELVKNVLLPHKPFKMKGVEVSSFYKPAGETHGNWHGFIEDMGNNRLSIFVGDAAGKGVPAALTTATAHSFIQTMGILRKRYEKLSKIIYKTQVGNQDKKEIPITLEPSYLLTLLNQILFQSSYGKQPMTFFATTLDLSKKKIYFANAGHEIPVFIKKKGGLPQALASSGPSLGNAADAKFEQQYLDLDQGDVIVWYTLGVIKCLNTSQEEYGNTRFLRKIREVSSLPAKEICKSIVDDINTFRKNKPLSDDITLVIAKVS